MLGVYRVLDLTDEKGQYCSKLLADLGCDVIKVERPGGDPARNLGPFWHDIPHPEKSLWWYANNLGKRSITLNIESGDGHTLFEELVKRMDVIVESFEPGYMDSLGLSYPRLRDLNPRLVVASISPFGQTGPYAGYIASDIIVSAMSGSMYLHGDADRAPVRFSAPQAFLHAATDAAQGILIALYERERTGVGQYIDVSAQESMVWIWVSANLSWLENEEIFIVREGNIRTLPNGLQFNWLYPCKDGFLFFFLLGGQVGARTNSGLVRWMKEEGMQDSFLESVQWETWDSTTATQQVISYIEDAFRRFFLTHTKQDLYLGANERGILVGPVWGARDWVRNPQLDYRRFWSDVAHPELGEIITYPGTCFQSSLYPRSTPRRAPLVGEHNSEIYVEELGLAQDQMAVFRQAGVI